MCADGSATLKKISEDTLMFKLGSTKSIFLAQIQQTMLGGNLFIEYDLVLQSVPAVRIPGGLTPP
ncbi:MAG: hypothetical protein C4323_11705 [Mastigocladus sp. ERB_26_2]